MKILKFKFLFLLITSVVLFAGCSDDPEEEVSPYVGNYVISNASLATALSISTNEMGTIPVAVGTDITLAIQTALLSAVSCSSASKSYVELRKDNSMYISCELQNALNAGTWEELNATTLKLNMNSAAIPSSPTGFVLTVTDVALTSAGISGKTSVPLPKAMVAAMVAPLTLTASSPEIYLANFSITFLKK